MRIVRGAAACVLAAVSWGYFGGALAASTPPVPPRGADAWWYRSLDLTQAHQQVTGKGVTLALIDGPVAPDVVDLRGQDVQPVVNVCGGEPTAIGEIADHTTALAATIVGNGKGNFEDGIGTAGVAPDASLRVYAVGSSVTEVSCGRTGVDGAALAIERAIDDGVRIIGYAGGAPRLRPTMAAAVQRALDAGIVVVAAAGDSRDDSVLVPASIPGVIAVAAVTRAGKSWSDNTEGNREAFVVAAPGVDLPIGGFFDKEWRSAALRTGTSEATAIVMGGVALAMQRWPQATGNQIVANLIHTATKPAGPTASPTPGDASLLSALPVLPVRDTDLGYGVVSVTGMLASDPARFPDVNPLVPPAPSPTPTPVPVAAVPPDEGLPWVVAVGAVAGTLVLVALFIGIRTRPRRPSASEHI